MRLLIRCLRNLWEVMLFDGKFHQVWKTLGLKPLQRFFLEKNGKRLIKGFGLGLPILKHLFQPLATQQTTLLPKTFIVLPIM